MINKINENLNKMTKDQLVPILLTPLFVGMIFVAINIIPIYKDIDKTINTTNMLKYDLETNLKNHEDYKTSQHLKTEVNLVNQELLKNNIDIRDLRKEFQWEYMIGLVNDTFIGPEILEYNDKYILFTSTEGFSSVYRKIKKFELDRKTSSIDYIFYNGQNKTYVIKINKKV